MRLTQTYNTEAHKHTQHVTRDTQMYRNTSYGDTFSHVTQTLTDTQTQGDTHTDSHRLTERHKDPYEGMHNPKYNTSATSQNHKLRPQHSHTCLGAHAPIGRMPPRIIHQRAHTHIHSEASLVAQTVKNPPAIRNP